MFRLSIGSPCADRHPIEQSWLYIFTDLLGKLFYPLLRLGLASQTLVE